MLRDHEWNTLRFGGEKSDETAEVDVVMQVYDICRSDRPPELKVAANRPYWIGQSEFGFDNIPTRDRVNADVFARRWMCIAVACEPTNLTGTTRGEF